MPITFLSSGGGGGGTVTDIVTTTPVLTILNPAGPTVTVDSAGQPGTVQVLRLTSDIQGLSAATWLCEARRDA